MEHRTDATARSGEAPSGRATRRYELLGAVAGWRLPLLMIALGVGALARGALEVAVAAVVLGWILHTVCRGLVIEVSPAGLSRGFVLRGVFLNAATVMPWGAIVGVHTDWRRPGDDSALETTVRDRDGRAISFSTSMGLARYWRCLADVVSRAPGAARTGLTDAALAEGPPARRHALSAATTAGALALLIVALVGLHWVLAQGRSSFVRDLEDQARRAATPPARAPR